MTKPNPSHYRLIDVFDASRSYVEAVASGDQIVIAEAWQRLESSVHIALSAADSVDADLDVIQALRSLAVRRKAATTKHRPSERIAKLKRQLRPYGLEVRVYAYRKSVLLELWDADQCLELEHDLSKFIAACEKRRKHLTM